MEIKSQSSACKIGNYPRSPSKFNPVWIGLILANMKHEKGMIESTHFIHRIVCTRVQRLIGPDIGFLNPNLGLKIVFTLNQKDRSLGLKSGRKKKKPRLAGITRLSRVTPLLIHSRWFVVNKCLKVCSDGQHHRVGMVWRIEAGADSS